MRAADATPPQPPLATEATDMTFAEPAAVPILPEIADAAPLPPQHNETVNGVAAEEWPSPMPAEAKHIAPPAAAVIRLALPKKRLVPWKIGATSMFFLLALSAALYWYVTFAGSHRYGSPAEIGAIYLAALASGNATAQQFYATEESTGDLLPNWFTVVNGNVEGNAVIHGKTAQVPVMLNLNLSLPVEDVSPALSSALAHPYHLAMLLRHERRGWQVDQIRLLQQSKSRC